MTLKVSLPASCLHEGFERRSLLGDCQSRATALHMHFYNTTALKARTPPLGYSKGPATAALGAVAQLCAQLARASTAMACPPLSATGPLPSLPPHSLPTTNGRRPSCRSTRPIPRWTSLRRWPSWQRRAPSEPRQQLLTRLSWSCRCCTALPAALPRAGCQLAQRRQCHPLGPLSIAGPTISSPPRTPQPTAPVLCPRLLRFLDGVPNSCHVCNPIDGAAGCVSKWGRLQGRVRQGLRKRPVQSGCRHRRGLLSPAGRRAGRQACRRVGR